MATEKITHYTQPRQFEPLLPQNRLDELRQRTRAVVVKSLHLTGSAHPATIANLRELVRAMNSYYSNRISSTVIRTQAWRTPEMSFATATSV